MPTRAGANAPETMYIQGLVWTGVEMIVIGWGNAGRPNPSTDSWLPTSMGTDELLNGRSAVWTGTEVIANLLGRGLPRKQHWVAVQPINRHVDSDRHRIGATITARVPHCSVDRHGDHRVGWARRWQHRGAVQPANRHLGTDQLGSQCAVGALRIHGGVDRHGNDRVGREGRGQQRGAVQPVDGQLASDKRGGECTVCACAPYGSVDRNGDDRLGGGWQLLVNTGGRYNPATDTWEATNLGGNVPSEARCIRRCGPERR